MGKNNKTIIHNIATALIFFALCAASVYWILLHPIPRQIGLTFRSSLYVFPLILVTAFFYGITQNQYVKIVISVLLFAMIAIVIINRKTVVVPIQKNVAEMQENEYLQVNGVLELKMLQTSYNEIYSRIRTDQQKLSYEATHDGLTGLLNRAAYDQKLSELKDQEICFLMIDVDDFKGINDTYGHDAGDAVLKKVAETLKHSFRNEDMIFRLGGDEFVVIMMHMQEDLKELVSRKVEMIREKLKDTSDGVSSVTLSIGAAFSKREDSTGNIAKDADLALYEVKKQGKGQMRFYEGENSEK